MPDKTALQQLKDWYNEYRDEYKANPTYFEVMVKIEKLLPVERDAIVDAVEKGRYMKHETGLYVTGEQYYRTKYGETE